MQQIYCCSFVGTLNMGMLVLLVVFPSQACEVLKAWSAYSRLGRLTRDHETQSACSSDYVIQRTSKARACRRHLESVSNTRNVIESKQNCSILCAAVGESVCCGRLLGASLVHHHQ